MAVLVTGALGAIGSAVVHRLVEDGHDVVAFDLRPDTELIADVAADIQVEVGDTRDWSLLARILHRTGVDAVIHLAVLLPDHAQRDPKLALEVNVGGTATICELARSFGLRRIVFASSKGVYKRVDDACGAPSYTPLDESYPIGPDGVYDVTKYAAEQLGMNYAASHGVDFIALRFAATYGPGRMARHGSLAIRSAIIENAFQGEQTVLAQGGDQGDDFVYTKDVAQGLVKALTAEAPTHRVFNIGTGLRSTLGAAAEILKREIPDARIEIGGGLDYGTGSGRYCVFDISRARAELGYEPAYDHKQGILDYLNVLAARERRDSFVS